MRRKYPQAGGEWVTPHRRGYKMMCCDCGLVHMVKLRLVQAANGRGFHIQWFIERDDRATAGARSRNSVGHVKYRSGQRYMLIYLGTKEREGV